MAKFPINPMARLYH